MRTLSWPATVALAVWAFQAQAESEPRFTPPVTCLESGACFIQNYVDLLPGPGHKDYRCGHLSYDGHKGTDFAVRDLRAMRRGVPVVASASGRVLRTRDGEPDGVYNRKRPDAVKRRECGNGAIIDHGNGWVGKYCHMRRGSVKVKPGDTVERGTPLGLIGMSGKAEFPHIHLTLTHNDQVIDPFSGPQRGTQCGDVHRSIWRDPSARVLDYRLTEPVKSGFAGSVKDVKKAADGIIDAYTVSRTAPEIIVWSVYKGGLPGDRSAFRLRAPDGKVLGKSVTKPVPGKKARVTHGYRVKRKGLEWPPGEYTADVRLFRPRDGKMVSIFDRKIRLKIH